LKNLKLVPKVSKCLEYVENLQLAGIALSRNLDSSCNTGVCRCCVSHPLMVFHNGMLAVSWKTALMTHRGLQTLSANYSTFSRLARCILYVLPLPLYCM